MKLLLFLFGTALAAGLYFVLADLLKIPRLATERALISAGRKERSLVKSLETLILGWSLKLAPLIRLDAYKRRRLETKLTAAGLDMTPEVYTAYTVLKPCLILLGIIPCLLILPILTPLVVVLALLTYFKESRRADELCKARMELVNCLVSWRPSIRNWPPAGMSCAFWRTTRNMPVLILPVNWMC